MITSNGEEMQVSLGLLYLEASLPTEPTARQALPSCTSMTGMVPSYYVWKLPTPRLPVLIPHTLPSSLLTSSVYHRLRQKKHVATHA